MLMMQRRSGQRIVLSGGIEIIVSSVRNGSVRLAIEAPRGVLVLRGETYDKVARANAEAAGMPCDDDDGGEAPAVEETAVEETEISHET